MGATLRLLVALFVIPSALLAQTRTIDFEDFSGPPVFDAAQAPLQVSSATFSGGEVLTEATFVPADPSTVYGTSFFCSGCLPVITINFSQRVSNLSLLVLNGQIFNVSYVIETDQGGMETVTLPANFEGGAAVVKVADHNIRTVMISGSAADWDFFIDNVSFTPSDAVLVDPVLSSALQGSSITTDTERLAAATDVVRGVAADGAAQVVLRVPASRAGESLTVTVLGEGGAESNSAHDNGGLAPLGGNVDNVASHLKVTAVATAKGPIAFAIYRAPRDFARGTEDQGEDERQVTLEIRRSDGSTTSSDVDVLRPPVVLIHGLWDSPAAWDRFTAVTNDSRFFVRRVDFSSAVTGILSSTPSYDSSDLKLVRSNALGFSYNAPAVLAQLRSFLAEFRHAENVAAAQADVVAHSMGGDLARTIALAGDFLSNDSFGKGLIHKLVTIGTPHLGTPLATKILQNGNACVRELLAGKGSISLDTATIANSEVRGAVGDLEGDGRGGSLSPALSAFSDHQPFPTAFLAGSINTNNTKGLDCTICVAAYIRFHCSDAPLAKALTSKGWETVFGQANDAIVPQTSQLDGGNGQVVAGVIHSGGVANLSFKGPDELDGGSGIPAKVVDLLNERLDGTDFRR